MPKQILLADDSAAAKKSVENALGTADYQLSIAEDGRVAIEQVNTAQPHLVLAHAMLPEIDGYEICRQIKENPATSHIPVLLLTGTFEPFDINRAKESRYDGFVTKPVDGPELFSLVNRLIENAVYPAVEAEAEAPAPDSETLPEAPSGEAEVSGASADPATITRSDALLDRIFPEDEPVDSFAGDDTIAVTDSGAEDIFAIIDAESEEETGKSDPAETADDGIERRSPDFGIWGGAGETTVVEDAVPAADSAPGDEEDAGEKQEIASEDSDLSWFLKKYEEKMQVAEDNPPVESDPPAMETDTSLPAVELPAVEKTEVVEEDAAAVEEVQASDDAGTGSEPPEESEPVPAPLPAAPMELRDGQLEQVARRVVELLSESVIRDVAWEAVPEIAERLIRERIREIEEEAESSK